LLAGLAGAAVSRATSEPELVAATDEFSEGPVFDSSGNLFFTHGRFVSRVRPDGRQEVWTETEGANGHKVLPDGTHLLCAPGEKAVLRLDENGKRLGVASDSCDGRPLRAPNDLTLDGRGGVYFTDPGGARERPVGTVHYLDAEGRTHLAAGGMWVPNGLVLNLDRRTLHVAETVPNRIVRFAVRDDGSLGEMEWFANLPDRDGHQAEPDGMAIDEAGNVYVAHLGTSTVRVLTPAGELWRSLDAGVYDASNLAFGGAEMNELYVTGSVGHRSRTPGRVYRLRLPGVRGVAALR